VELGSAASAHLLLRTTPAAAKNRPNHAALDSDIDAPPIAVYAPFPHEQPMANEALVDAIKQILALSKSGDEDGANSRYAELFQSAEFASYRPEDQRQALKLVILAKRKGALSPAAVETHRAAIAPLSALVTAHSEPLDYEMLGICQLVIGESATAAETFRIGLDLERAREPESDLCGRLMKRYSSI
jgi:hypothetical protein